MSELIIRPLSSADEFFLFTEYRPVPLSGVGQRSRTFDEYVADGDYRPEWTWVAQRGGEVVARAAFWAPPGEAHPWGLDWFDPGAGPDRVDVGAALLRAAYATLAGPDYEAAPHPGGSRPDYHLFLPGDWRERPDAAADASDRIAAAEGAGLELFVERINLRRTLTHGLPARSTRLRFEPAQDEEVVIDVLARVCVGTLDAYAQRDVDLYGPRPAAERLVEEVAGMPGPGRDWWRVAYTHSGDVAGVVLPTRNPAGATIGYLGVVPEQRGHGYSADLAAEALHIFAAAGEREVDDATDVANAPMAATLMRCGYRVVGRRIIMR